MTARAATAARMSTPQMGTFHPSGRNRPGRDYRDSGGDYRDSGGDYRPSVATIGRGGRDYRLGRGILVAIIGRVILH